MRDRRRASYLLLTAVLLPGMILAGEWADRYRAWHGANEFQCYGNDNSANLAWWESYLLQSYLPMYRVSGDVYWLDRLVAHADRVLEVARDVPASAAYWDGYRDGFTGWGTTRYDAQGRYQEYMLHDARICLPLARFARLVLGQPERYGRYEKKARHYVAEIEKNVVTKWHRSLSAKRGGGEALETFGGWRKLPSNQFLAFGELLLVLADIARMPGYTKASAELPDGFYIETAEAMARAFKTSLAHRAGSDAYVWRSTLAGGDWEDLAHGDLAVSFALEAHRQGRVFTAKDMERFARCLTRIARTGNKEAPGLANFVDGSGGPDKVGSYCHWLQLEEFDGDIAGLIASACLTAEKIGPQTALTMAQLAELEASSPDGRRHDLTSDRRNGARVAGTGLSTPGVAKQHDR